MLFPVFLFLCNVIADTSPLPDNGCPRVQSIDSRVTSFCNLNATLTCSENRKMALNVSFRPLVSSYLEVEVECDMTLATFMFFLV